MPDEVDSALGEDWVEERMGEWVVWPSEGDVKARGPLRDRRAEFPTVRNRRGLVGPLGLGALSPDEAQADAEEWVRRIVRPELTPADLSSRFVLLQEEDPSRSSVLCRFEANRTGIQIIQLRWAFCAVVRPDPALTEGLEPEAIGPAVFHAAFVDGPGMAEAQTRPVEGLPYCARVAGPVDTPPGWAELFWYTDGQSVAAYARRCRADGDPVQAGDPWF